MKVTVGEEDSVRSIVPSNRISGKRLSLYILSCFLLVVAAIGIAVGGASRKSAAPRISSEAQAILRSACSSTLHPNLCVSAVAARPGVADSLFTHKNVIEASLNITTQIVEHNYFAIRKLAAKRRGSLTERERAAFLDCLEMVNETLGELRTAAEELKGYPTTRKSLAQHADDISTLLSASITNQETCLDGFSSAPADEDLREAVLGKEENAEHMCSNALAMFKNMSDTDMATAGVEKRRLEAAAAEGGWPGWLSSGDRRLLQSPSEWADTVVAGDGSGKHRTVSAAVEAAPKKSRRRYVIRIKAGVYRENVVVPKSMTNIMFAGDDRSTTVITASKNVVDGSTTFHSATVAVVGQGFLARGVTFENTAGPSKHQAVALRVGSDLSAFYQCDMLAYQDTLYVHSNRQFYINCLVAGTVDFIFGNAAAVFQDCDIHARRPNADQKNMVTAQSRSDPNQNTGIVIQKCRIGATPELRAVRGSFRTFLGRPWKQYSRTVVMQTAIEDVIAAEGWHEWNGSFALDTLYYGEYRNTGTGAPTTNRVKWKGFHVITSAAVAQGFTAGSFVGGRSWLSGTGFPDSLGL